MEILDANEGLRPFLPFFILFRLQKFYFPATRLVLLFDVLLLVHIAAVNMFTG